MSEINIETIEFDVDGQLALEGTEELLQTTVPTVEEVVRDILDTLPNELTMYQVAKALNTALEIFEIQKNGNLYQVRPQMMYNYNRNKLIVKGVVIEGKATREQAETFIIKFVNKLITK